MTNTTNTSLKQTVTGLLKQADSGIINLFFGSEFSTEHSKYNEEDLTELINDLAAEGITVEHVDNFGGEGQGDDYWSVYKFQRGTEEVLIKFQGWYQSYNGSEFSEFFVCEPQPKTGFDYVEVK